MSARVSRRARIHGLPAIQLENKWLKVSILPGVGAKIYDLVWKPTGKNILWHNPRILPQTYPIESGFDNYWCGGWDDAFPTCDECVFRGQRYPSLGELRSLRWKVDSTGRQGGSAVARLSTFGPISPVSAVKTVTIEGQAPVVRMHYKIVNLGPMNVDFLWGTHPAVSITDHTILHIPARHGIAAQCNDLALGHVGQRYDWPILETKSARIAMDKVQGIDANLCFGHYAIDLEDGWYAIEDAESGEGFLVRFPLDQCPCLWLWLNYGGWRGLHHVIVEPWTSVPVNLAQAHEQKTSRCLRPGEEFSVEVRATLYHKPETLEDALGRL
ncbi:MAG: hypothetical protein ABSG54_02560 [Terriglobia bacterium]|jgi:galactose mutarotase-like enzyme